MSRRIKTAPNPQTGKRAYSWLHFAMLHHLRNLERIEADCAAAPADTPEAERKLFGHYLERMTGSECGAFRDCRERACRRARVCLAPHHLCSNPLPFDETEEDILLLGRLEYVLDDDADDDVSPSP